MRLAVISLTLPLQAPGLSLQLPLRNATPLCACCILYLARSLTHTSSLAHPPRYSSTSARKTASTSFLSLPLFRPSLLDSFWSLASKKNVDLVAVVCSYTLACSAGDFTLSDQKGVAGSLDQPNTRTCARVSFTG